MSYNLSHISVEKLGLMIRKNQLLLLQRSKAKLDTEASLPQRMATPLSALLDWNWSEKRGEQRKGWVQI